LLDFPKGVQDTILLSICSHEGLGVRQIGIVSSRRRGVYVLIRLLPEEDRTQVRLEMEEEQ
jgi:hypothetical protein